jgi:hypothetical protein
VRGTQICNLFGQIRPPDATKIKINLVVVRGKNSKNLQILKLQYLEFSDFVSDDFFFQLGCFSKRNSDIQPFSANFAQKYTKNFKNVAALFFSSPKKKSAKIKKYFPTMSAQGKFSDTTC